MSPSVLDVALAASLSPEVSTQAIKITLGLHAEIAAALAKPNRTGPRTEAFLAREWIEHATGMDHRTIPVAAEEAAEQIGLVVRSSDGVKNRLMHATRHGEAAGWTLGQPRHFAPHNAGALPREAQEFLAPANTLWSRNDRAWRLAMVLVASHGYTTVQIRTSEVAALLGTSLTNATKALTALAEATIGERTARGCWTFFLDRNDVLTDTRIAHQVKDRAQFARKAWVEHLAPAPEVVESEVIPLPVAPEPVAAAEPQDYVSNDALRALQERLRAQHGSVSRSA